MRRLLDLLLTTDPVRRLRLAQSLVAAGIMSVAVLVVLYFGLAGLAPRGAVTAWAAVNLAALAIGWVLIRSGWTRRFADATLTVPQMVFAVASSAVAYALLGPARAGVLTILMVALMLGMFVASPRQMRGVSLYAVAVLGATMALLAWRSPATHPPLVELGHFLLAATMLPAVALLAGRLSHMRHRLRQQRLELAQAVERIRQLATRDELTGLVNRRHILELLEQEHQRSVRSGRAFSIALLDVVGLKAINGQWGRAAGDELLRQLGIDARRLLRVSDVLARWGGDEFLVLLSDTRLNLARGSVERLREQLGGPRTLPGGVSLQVRLTAGVVEHHAGESMAQTLARATQALAEARHATP
jgi:diguanylate cyclase (GGDEF)-like protein